MFGVGGRRARVDTYTHTFTAISGLFAAREDVDNGGKVLLPASVLGEISTMELVYPLQFEVKTFKGTKTHCGVLEFVADEGQVVMPQWMMDTLRLDPMDLVQLTTVVLPKGSFVKIRPEQKAFIELSNPKAVLESRLTNFSTMTKGDVITINYRDKKYHIDILELRSKEVGSTNAVSIVDTEIEVDFDRPLDMPASPMKDESLNPGPNAFDAPPAGINFAPTTDFAPPKLSGGPGPISPPPEPPKFVPFGGGGKSLSGRAPLATPAPATLSAKEPASVGRTLSAKASEATTNQQSASGAAAPENFAPFSGGGFTVSGRPASAAASAPIPPSTSTGGSNNNTSSAAAVPPPATPFAGKGRSLRG